MQTLGELYLETVTRNFRGLRSYAEKAIEQLDDEQLHASVDPRSNTVAILMRHLGGNMRSRWTDFLTADGEKADRKRAEEFEKKRESRDELLAAWNGGWETLLATIASLREEDLQKEVSIKGERLPAMLAINRAVQHYAYHVGQICYLAKHLTGERWSSMS